MLQTSILLTNFISDSDALTPVAGWSRPVVFQPRHLYSITGQLVWIAGGSGMQLDFDGGDATVVELEGVAVAADNFQGRRITSLGSGILAVDDSATTFQMILQANEGGVFNLRFAQQSVDEVAAELATYTTIQAQDITP